MRFMNDDYAPINVRFNAPAITIDEFKEKLSEIDLTKTFDQEGSFNVFENMRFDGHAYEGPFIESDFFVRDVNDAEPLVGYHVTPGGVPYLGIGAFGEDGYVNPMFLILYWDGAHISTYVPLRGNAVNLELECFFGQHNDSKLGRADAMKLATEYFEAGILPDDDCVQDLEDYECGILFEILYLMKYGVLPMDFDLTGPMDELYERAFMYGDDIRDDLVFFNWQAMAAEIDEVLVPAKQ